MREPDNTASPDELAEQVRRDLKWAVTSADHWLNEFTVPWRESGTWFLPWVQALSYDTLAEANLFSLQKRRLGHYFEALWLFYLQHHPQWHIRLSNHVVYHLPPNDKTTEGEIDAVIQHDTTGELVHLELAVKFYLWVPMPDELHAAEQDDATCWVGSSLRDSLARKRAQLHHRQLPLGGHPQVLTALGTAPERHECVMKGRGFLPWSAEHPQRSGWLSLSAYEQNFAASEAMILPRQHWLAGPDVPQWCSYDELQEPLKHRAPVLLWVLTNHEAGTHTALFVVPDDWLLQAQDWVRATRTALNGKNFHRRSVARQGPSA